MESPENTPLNESITQSWINREKSVHIQFYRRLPVVFERGRGCYLYDVEGNRYLDLVAGIAVCALGHCHPKLVERLKNQLEKLMHTSNLFYTIPQIELAEKLREITGMDFFFFCNSGTEAVEASLKVSRKVTGRKKFVAFTGSFHGRTMGALSVTWKEMFRKPFLPLVEPVEFAEFNSVESLKRKVDENTAAVIVEPVQGEGGVNVADEDFLNAIFELKEKYDYLVIFDEVQTGFGRTGKWFAKDHFNLQPDVMAMAKGMGSGFPVGGIGVSGEVAEKLGSGEHASTFGGNPLACSAALATIEVMEEEKLVENAKKMGKALKDALYEVFGNSRGMGLMLAVNCEGAFELVNRALKNFLLINATSESSLRFVPPLVIGKEEIEIARDILSGIV